MKLKALRSKKTGEVVEDFQSFPDLAVALRVVGKSSESVAEWELIDVEVSGSVDIELSTWQKSVEERLSLLEKEFLKYENSINPYTR